MRVAKLPNGVRIQFPDDVSDEDMDALVQKYLASTEGQVQKYLLNEEALSSMLTMTASVEKALDSLNTSLEEMQKAQNTIIDKFEDVLKASVSGGQDVKKALDVMTKTNFTAMNKVSDGLSKLVKAIEAPLKFNYDAKGNMTGAE